MGLCVLWALHRRSKNHHGLVCALHWFYTDVICLDEVYVHKHQLHVSFKNIPKALQLTPKLLNQTPYNTKDTHKYHFENIILTFSKYVFRGNLRLLSMKGHCQ